MNPAVKVSVSIRADDLALLKRRAKRLHGGNVSAVIAELAETIRRQDARDQLLAAGEATHGPATRSELDAIVGEWTPRRRKAR